MPKRKIGSVDENLGRNLIFFRKLAGLTQQQVADRLNLNRTTYTKYETGASEPSIEILKALAVILEVDVSLLLTDEMDPDLVEDVIEGYHHSADRFFSVWKQFDDLDEQLHIELMQAMVNLNRSDEAAAEYRRLAKRSREFYDAEPGEELQACYKSLAEAGKTIRINLDTIRNELIEKEGGTKGPFFCEYEVFKEVYNIYMRNLERLGSTMFLGIIMLGYIGDNSSDVRRESCMAGLQQILKSNMRKGDIITRFSDNIYAMLLPTVNYSSGNMVMERIENLYYREYSSLAISFFARISPLGTSSL